ncbi:MAG TPA: thiamine-phosphate kinase [Steroidobacteraceae bacterium]
MALGEFALIARYFSAVGAARADVRVGVGDDAAVLQCPPDAQLVAAIDTLVEGVHFPAGSAPQSIGHRALAVNLSDLAAMGARPAWALLALTLPRAEERWLEDFARGFDALARRHDLALVGGDTTRGPLCVSVQVLGFAPQGRILLRGGARLGDALYVTGHPGDAACGLGLEQGTLAGVAAEDAQYLRARFLYPEPRVEWGTWLIGRASACIDVSDGLLGDAAKLAAASACGVQLDVERLPLSGALRRACGAEQALRFALSGGDDYELLFTVPQPRVAHFEQEAAAGAIACSRIGTLCAGGPAQLRRAGNVIEFSHSGYDHFAL